VLAEVAQLEVLADKIACRLGDEHLPAVGSCHYARRAMDVDPDVSLLGDNRFAGVDPDAHAHGAVAESTLRLSGGGEPV